jgi:hypothetical protein
MSKVCCKIKPEAVASYVRYWGEIEIEIHDSQQSPTYPNTQSLEKVEQHVNSMNMINWDPAQFW